MNTALAMELVRHHERDLVRRVDMNRQVALARQTRPSWSWWASVSTQGYSWPWKRRSAS